jgi:hypothetical protein
MISQIGLMLVLIFVGVGVNVTNDDGCSNYYGDNESSAQDLLLRTWCNDLDEISPPR